MKLLLAGLFVVLGMLGVVVIFSIFLPTAPAWLMSVIMVIVFFGLLISALAIFNASGLLRGPRYDPAIQATKLETQGLLFDQSFKARRCFQVEEFEDEGSHYFIELEGGNVLFLSGQYLYDYEPLKKGSEIVRPRSFPNSEFVVRRHKLKDFVVHIACSGSVLEPEVVAPVFDADDFGTDRIPWDGHVIIDRSFDQLKAERLKGRAT